MKKLLLLLLIPYSSFCQTRDTTVYIEQRISTLESNSGFYYQNFLLLEERISDLESQIQKLTDKINPKKKKSKKKKK